MASTFDKYKLKGNKHFSEEQISYLTSSQTLTRWAAKSLEERVRLFQRRYPQTKTTVYKLRKLYQQQKIRKKVVRIGKAPRQASLMDMAIQAAELSQDVQLALEKRLKLVQIDEFMITNKTLATHAWTPAKENIRLDQAQAFERAYAVVMAISRERGVELVDVYRKSINKQKFKMFLQRLRQLNQFDDVLLIMDNISFHKSADTKERMDELGFHYAYTPAYSPDYNGIENCIGIGKQAVKQKRLELITTGEKVDLRKVIHDCFASIEPQQVALCIAKSLQLLALNQ